MIHEWTIRTAMAMVVVTTGLVACAAPPNEPMGTSHSELANACSVDDTGENSFSAIGSETPVDTVLAPSPAGNTDETGGLSTLDWKPGEETCESCCGRAGYSNYGGSLGTFSTCYCSNKKVVCSGDKIVTCTFKYTIGDGKVRGPVTEPYTW